MPTPPGKSLVPVFTHDGSVSHDYFWWFHDGNRAIRMGDWKLVADHKKPFELYDMRTDRSETHDLAADHPDKVRELEQAWTQHMEQFLARRPRRTCPQGRLPTTTGKPGISPTELPLPQACRKVMRALPKS